MATVTNHRTKTRTVARGKVDFETVADLVRHFGNIPARRIRLSPPPGTASEKDVLRLEARTDRLYELVDGVLIEKAMGFHESLLAAALIEWIRAYVSKKRRGIVTGEAGMMRLAAGLVRIPDVAFVSWERLPGRRIPKEPIPDLAPDLAIEVLSPGNTRREMARKLDDYFASGVRLAWFVDLRKRTVTVYTSPTESTVLDETDVLEGAPVLPGFTLPLRDLFAELDAHG